MIFAVLDKILINQMTGGIGYFEQIQTFSLLSNLTGLKAKRFTCKM